MGTTHNHDPTCDVVSTLNVYVIHMDKYSNYPFLPFNNLNPYFIVNTPSFTQNRVLPWQQLTKLKRLITHNVYISKNRSYPKQSSSVRLKILI